MNARAGPRTAEAVALGGLTVTLGYHRGMNRSLLSVALVSVSCLSLAACQTVREKYYNAWEAVGYDKRERLVADVQDARDAQTEAKEQFQTTLEEFKSIVQFDGGNLESVYNQLNDQLEDSQAQADEVNQQIQQVKNVGQALFSEWSGEIEQISDPELVRESEKLYKKTERRFEDLVSAMDDAAATMDPVIRKFRDRVLFLKTNLNAAAIASLEGYSIDLSKDIDRLIVEMEQSIAEADRFIGELGGQG